ncbi:MAG: hypothetical protein ABUT39_08505 [Acidobacteriota bacterium]
MRMRFRALSFACVLAALAPLTLAAQEIQVKDLDTDEIIETVGPGGTITLSEGDHVRLIMTVQAKGRTYYPQTEYWEGQKNGGAVRITRASVENANATVEAVSPGRSETIGYRILEDVRARTEGSVTIRVESEAASGPAPSPGGYGDWAREITNTLYQAILMRDMDAEGGRGYSDRIRRGGYSTVVQVAQEMARSEESRVRIYERQINNRQRLEALYENLLGLDADDVDDEDWTADLRRLNDGRIADVVSDMVRSSRFREYQDL